MSAIVNNPASSLDGATLATVSGTPSSGNLVKFADADTVTNATATEVTAALDAFTGDSGSGGVKGLVPAPAAGDTAAGKFLRADGIFAVPAAVGLNLTTTPQGRLTLTTATPNMVTTVTGAGTVYYTPAVGQFVPVYNGTTWVATSFNEVSQALTDSTKSPAAATTNSNYDMFVWSDSGTIRCTRGPAWSGDTSRGTGAGTTELTFVNGLLMNANSITNGPAAQRGVYVGSIRTNGSSTVDHIFGGVGAAGGEGTILGLWNMYNRRFACLANLDNTDSWNYTTATWRIKNNNNNNKISFIIGWQGDGIDATNMSGGSNSTTNVFQGVSIGLNSTTAFAVNSANGCGRSSSVSSSFAMVASLKQMAPVGFNYVAPLEFSTATGTSTWFGDNAGGSLNCLFFMTTTF